MFGIGKRHETEVTVYSYVVEETNGSDSTSESSSSSGRHCAWCGDPGDENGSHTICSFHEAQMLAAMAERRRSRGRS